MKESEIESLLQIACVTLTRRARSRTRFTSAKQFEEAVRTLLTEELKKRSRTPTRFLDQDFPDIVAGDWGVEVKYTQEDKWRTVANSVFEGHRKNEVTKVYLIFAKMGGTPEVRWSRYEDAVVHVRTSHRPRYEVEIGATTSLFTQMGIDYARFRKLDERAKMRYVRDYARGRLRSGEQLWWLGDDPENPHSLPLAVRLYTKLTLKEKTQLRAEAAFLCPEIVKPGRTRDKYNKAALHLLTYHGVLALQARDMFSAGSVGNKGNNPLAGKYLPNALKDIEPEIRHVAENVDPALISEFWQEPAPKTTRARLRRWLAIADGYATDWTPSDVLFTDGD